MIRISDFRASLEAVAGIPRRWAGMRAFCGDALQRTTVPRILRCQTGASAVEFALIAAPLIMVTFGSIEFGRALWVKNAMAHRLDRIERGILILQGPPSSNAQDVCKGKPYVDRDEGRQKLVNSVGSGASTVTISAPEIITRDTIKYSFVTVRITQTISLAIPFFDSGSYTMRLERKVIVPAY